MTPFKTSEPAKAKKFSHQQAGDVSITNGVLAVTPRPRSATGFARGRQWSSTSPSSIADAMTADASEKQSSEHWQIGGAISMLSGTITVPLSLKMPVSAKIIETISSVQSGTIEASLVINATQAPKKNATIDAGDKLSITLTGNNAVMVAFTVILES